MIPTAQISNALYIERVLRARQMPPEEKLLDGLRLFTFACESVRAGIRAQHPHATPGEVAALLRDRIKIMRSLEEMNHG